MLTGQKVHPFLWQRTRAPRHLATLLPSEGLARGFALRYDRTDTQSEQARGSHGTLNLRIPCTVDARGACGGFNNDIYVLRVVRNQMLLG